MNEFHIKYNENGDGTVTILGFEGFPTWQNLPDDIADKYAKGLNVYLEHGQLHIWRGDNKCIATLTVGGNPITVHEFEKILNYIAKAYNRLNKLFLTHTEGAYERADFVLKHIKQEISEIENIKDVRRLEQKIDETIKSYKKKCDAVIKDLEQWKDEVIDLEIKTVVEKLEPKYRNNFFLSEDGHILLRVLSNLRFFVYFLEDNRPVLQVSRKSPANKTNKRTIWRAMSKGLKFHSIRRSEAKEMIHKHMQKHGMLTYLPNFCSQQQTKGLQILFKNKTKYRDVLLDSVSTLDYKDYFAIGQDEYGFIKAYKVNDIQSKWVVACTSYKLHLLLDL